MPLLSSNRLLCAALLLLAPVATVPTQAIPFFGTKQKDILSGAPPLPVPLSISVDRKQIAQIPLRVLGPQPELVRFVLRTQPQHGTASLLTPSQSSEAVVEYRPPEDRSLTSDQFGFAAGNSKGFSSEATVQIRIIDKAGQIDLPPRIEFPKARVGSPSLQTLRLRNSGDAPVLGSISVSPPWTIDLQTYVLKPQEETSLQISLLPSSSGSLQGELHFSHNPEHPVQLKASVDEWIQAAPDPLKLTPNPGSRDRSGTLLLKNDSSSPETVLLESDPPLVHPSKITLQPGSSEEVSFKIANIQSEPFGGTLRLTKDAPPGSHSPQRLLLWTAEAIGPILRTQTLSTAHTIVPEDPSLFTPITFQNEGGREGVWYLQTTPPFAVDSSLIRLLPGKSIEIRVSTPTRTAGPTEGFLKINGAGQSFEFPLAVTPTASAALKISPHQSRHLPNNPLASPSSGTSFPSSSAAMPLPMDLPSSDRSRSSRGAPLPVDPEIAKLTASAYLPGLAIKGSKLHSITHRSATLNIPLPETITPQSLLIQTLNLLPDKNDNMSVQWDPVTAISWTRTKPGQTELLFHDLLPATNYSIRILGPSGKNGRRIALHQFDFTTIEEPHWFTLKNIALTLAGTTALLFLRQRLRARRRGW